MKMTKGLTWPLLLLALATTLVYMVGLATLQHSCYNTGYFSQALGGGRAGAFGLSTGANNCQQVFRFHWFIFAFVLVALLGLLITTAMGAGLHYSRPFWVGMLAVSTLLMMIASESFLSFVDLFDNGNSSFWWLARLRTAAAGAIMTVASLVLLMMAVGTDWEHRKGVHGRVDDKPTTGVTGVAAPVQNVRMVEQV